MNDHCYYRDCYKSVANARFIGKQTACLVATLVSIGLLFGCFVSSVVAGEKLYNGIELSTPWPPPTSPWNGEPMPVPYLQNRPDVVPIDLGRQLFVDDFLIEATNLTREFHRPRYHPSSPVLKPETSWEMDAKGDIAAPYSDGVWYDPARQIYRMWYHAAEERTCLAESKDGIHWMRPTLDVVAGTNIVLTNQNRKSIRNSNTIWLDGFTAQPDERYKLFEARYARSPYRMAVRTSPDGIHWSDERAVSAEAWDRSTAFYNPFRKVWVASIRGHDQEKPAPPHRLRNYFEGKTPEEAVGWKVHTDEVSKGKGIPGDLQPWVGSDRLDPHHPDPRFAHIKPQLYNLDVFPYESLLVGLFVIWQGPTNEICQELKIHKRNEVFVGTSRDGFHWHRPDRQPFLPVSKDPAAWNAGNVQSVGGGCCVVDDELRFYCTGRTMQPRSIWSSGLAMMRRDGFASMNAAKGAGELTTRPVRFSGQHLFVNVAPGDGELRVEVLNREGIVQPGYGRDDCIPLRGDATRAKVTWREGRNLETFSEQPVRFRFVLTGGSLFSFWVTRDPNGASGGYVAAGGPNWKGPRDE